MEFFFNSMFTTFRETLEATFIFIIIVSLLRFKAFKTKGTLISLLGAVIGALSAVGFGIGLHELHSNFNHNRIFNIVFDTIILISIIVFLSMMIFGGGHASQIRKTFARASGVLISLFFVIAISFFREGTEIVLLTFNQIDVWGIVAGFLTALALSVVLWFISLRVSLKKLMFWLTLILIFTTSPIVAKWFDDVMENQTYVYKVDTSNQGTNFGMSLLRGLVGIKSKSTGVGLGVQITWVGIFIPLHVYSAPIKTFIKSKFTRVNGGENA